MIFADQVSCALLTREAIPSSSAQSHANKHWRCGQTVLLAARYASSSASVFDLLFDRLWVIHPRLPEHCCVIPRTVLQCLTHMVVIQRIKEAELDLARVRRVKGARIQRVSGALDPRRVLARWPKK